MSKVKYLTHRGDLRAVATLGKSIYFATQHSERFATALYRLDVEKHELTEIASECGGLSLVAHNDGLWLGGDDAKLYHLAPKGKSLTPLKASLPAPATALEVLAGGRLAAICENELLIVETKSGAVSQTVKLADKGTAVSADPGGEWLAVGTNKGDVSVYELGEAGEFVFSETARLHEGAVTSLRFEPEELRFFSAGADQKLLRTHARGKLEPEDRGRGNSHSDRVTQMLLAPGERLITVSRDRACKTWAQAGATRPATFDDAVPAVIDAAITSIHDRPHLVIAGADNTLWFILLDAGGRFAAMTHRFYDAYDKAAHSLENGDVAQRGDAIHALAAYDDGRSVEMLAKQSHEDADHGLRLRAAELLAKSSHARVTELLESLLSHNDEKVRLAAFQGLRDALGKDDLRPLELALAARKSNVGIAAVAALASLARKDELARQLLIRSFNHDTEDVRRAALLKFEEVVAKDSPEPTMIAAKANQPDTRRLGLIRAFQRKLLGDSRIAGAVRRSGQDSNADVRRTAFLIALLSRPKLATAIRHRDKELHRQLFELENFSTEPKKGSKAKSPPKIKPTKATLKSDDVEPLLSAMASRVVETAMLGSKCLALLGDPRALGTLLQLSREEATEVRVEACRALAALADTRAEQRLETLLNDSAAEVRDAAYSALEKIHDELPLQAADTGLKSSYVDARRRSLKTLAATLQRSQKETVAEAAQEMLLRALNDDEDSVNGEAFKTTLGLQIGGSQETTLRFALRSVRTNVRREVLTETMAHDKQDWAAALLLDMVNDPAPAIRADAYRHLVRKGKGRDVGPMKAALTSQYADIRLSAAKSLIRLKTKEAQEVLSLAIDDDDAKVREEAVAALIGFDVVETVQQAMTSRHADVRLQAAVARAMFHDEQAAQSLLDTATAPEPEREADQPRWKKNTVVALKGLGMLGFPSFTADLLPLLESDHDPIRKAAATAIASCVRSEQVDTLTPLLQHSDPQVRYRIAMGLAFCQSTIALPICFSEEAKEVLGEKDRLMAAIAYGEPTRTQLASFLDSGNAWVRNAAFLVLLFRDWKAHTGAPARILAALSAQDVRIRLAAARALETFADAQAFTRFVVDFVNDRGDQQAWKISLATIEELATGIVFAEPRCQSLLTTVLQELIIDKQKQWDFSWRIHSLRYAKELSAAGEVAEAHRSPKLATTVDECKQLAFGTYVGLVRQQTAGEASFGATVVAVRQEAIRRLVAMSDESPDMLAAARPVLVQALSDNYQPVRLLAFTLLPRVGCDDALRAQAAIECGQTDLAVEALKLLSAAAGAKGQRVLEEVILSRDDALATEAGELLMRMTDTVTAAKVALESPHAPSRSLAVRWLGSAYKDDTKAKKILLTASKSQYAAVRRDAAVTLAQNEDKQAFDLLVQQLQEASDARSQAAIRNALAYLGDPRTPSSLLDLLEADQTGRFESGHFFPLIGGFRDPAIVNRLLPLLERKDWRTEVARCIVQISGHDQTFYDGDDEDLNRHWMQEQHPRHDIVLAMFLETCHQLNLPNLALQVMRSARWSLSDAVDHVLALYAVHSDDAIRNQVVEAMGWRLRHRAGSADALVVALGSRDTTTRFLAAEGLARGGRDDGITVLLSAVELMTDLSGRVRAVNALGELGDERALEVLLKLVNHDGHALQDAAAAAIGHLGESEQAEEIFQILKQLSAATGSVQRNAIVGLRHLNTPRGWELIREMAAAENYEIQSVLLQQLGYNDQPETRQLLIDMLKGNWTELAITPAKRLFGEDSLLPDYAALQSEDGYYAATPFEQQHHCLERVCEQGDSEQILKILPNVYGCLEELAEALLQRDPLPVTAAAAALESETAYVTEVAAAIVGRVAKKEYGKHLVTALEKWLTEWNRRRLELLRSSDWYEDANEEISNALCRLAWAVGRTGAPKKVILSLLNENTDAPAFVMVRRSAANAFGEGKLTASELTALEAFVNDHDAGVRQTIASVIARHDVSRAARHAAELISDRSVYRQLNAAKVDTTAVANSNADHAHIQPIVLPELVAAAAVKRLSEVASNKANQESAQLGAVEALACIASKSGDKQLAAIGNDDTLSEEVQKAAWRGLRRSKRVQAKVGN